MQFSHYLFLIFFRHGWGHLNLKDFEKTVDKDVILRLISIKDKSLMRIREESELQLVSDDGGETTDTELNSSREGPMGIPEDQRTPRGSRHWSSESGSGGAPSESGASEAAEAAEAQSTTDDDIQIVDELFYVDSSDDDDDDGDVEGRGRNWSSDHEHETESDENEENVPTDTSIVTVIESDRSNPPPAPQEQPGNATPGPSPTGPVPASGSGSPELTLEPEPPQDEPNNNVAASGSDSDISELTVDTVVALVHQAQPNEDEPTEP